MCGIYFSISREGFLPPSTNLVKLLSSRGPDSINEHNVQIAYSGVTSNLQSNGITYLSFTSSVLSVRGNHVTEQPLIDQNTGSLLCWNGDAWKIKNVPIVGNDTEAVFSLLLKATASFSPESVGHLSSTDGSHYGALEALSTAIESISGPFAFVYYDAPNQRILLGRDCLGRRSLLQRYDDRGNLIISSISDKCQRGNWSELDEKGIYWVDLTDSGFHSHEAVVPGDGPNGGDTLTFPFYRLSKLQWEFTQSRTEMAPVEPHLISPLNPAAPSVLQLRQLLAESLALRIRDIPELIKPSNPSDPAALLPGMAERPAKVAILFSGGLDCTVLARLAHDILPSDQAIDLLNVAFENPRVVEASKANRGKDTKTKKKGRNSRIALTQSDPTSMELETPMSSHPIEAAKHKLAIVSGMQSAYEMCPDRITGKKSLAELREICHGRQWNFIEVNIPYSEALEHREKIISLIHPHNTEMDLSIAYAFYFAARGAGVVHVEEASEPLTYSTPARILVSGLGADELFAGYSRHGAAFSRSGFPGLLESMDLDIKRLGGRNLGRDDRVIAHHGKHARYPYLDEALLAWALRTPVWVKTGFGQDTTDEPSGGELHLDPEKRILRLLAWNLGMRDVARERKRAVRNSTPFR
ncbi:hypothetical protein FGG08_004785 [Glutinoglossum americanum]|uniref:Glutamine amidotransferase type-2 domain-containing protein n=1 Tax=Glutinoglossum americanum TaxID=1670608 RepID=A0A9P8KZ75_9PEZI|nr:hypothetical protein FGG08_004785 [Glutinoglossum americanum]